MGAEITKAMSMFKVYVAKGNEDIETDIEARTAKKDRFKLCVL